VKAGRRRFPFVFALSLAVALGAGPVVAQSTGGPLPSTATTLPSPGIMAPASPDEGGGADMPAELPMEPQPLAQAPSGTTAPSTAPAPLGGAPTTVQTTPSSPTPLQQFVPPGQPGAQASQQPAEPPVSRPLTLQAGTGTLIRLPRPAATVMSAQPNVARVQPASPISLFLMGVTPGRTTIIATSDNGNAIAEYDVTVTPVPGAATAAGAAPAPEGGAAAPAAGAEITPATARMIRSAIARGVKGANNIDVIPAGETVVLTGAVTTPQMAEQIVEIVKGFVTGKAPIIDRMTVSQRVQVNVRVRFAEVSRQVTRALGINWQALAAGSGFRFGFLTGAAATGAITPLLGTGATAFGNTAYSQLGAGFTSGSWNVDGIIDALAQDQLITVLAEPNLTALSGETASFLAGGEFPVPVSGNGSGGSAAITVQYQPYGVSLSVVPTVLSDTRLNLRIRPEVSQISQTGAISEPVLGGTLTIPALTVNRAETTIELGSGQSFAIAGLLQRLTQDQSNAIPGLGEMPVLGALFKSTAFQRGDTELVIVVTPYIVKPAVSPTAFRTPVDDYKPATDLDRILFGRQLAPVRTGQRLDAGFMLK
jgi:pilus assembly protein CpaC